MQVKKIILIFIIIVIGRANLYTQSITILTEGFEHAGAMPTNWTQEKDASNLSWTFESENYYSPYAGTYYADLFAASSGKVTKLVTPSINLSGTTNPQLTFWHIQEAWNGQDELRIYYKTTSGGSWTLIEGAVWTSAVTAWTKRTITLPSPSSTYYIAFEGTANYGNSVGIDEVSVFWKKPYPGTGTGTQEDPYQVSTLACLSWIAQNSDQWGKYYLQTANIDATSTQYWDDADQNGDGDLYNDTNDGVSTGNNEGFSPIGNNTTKFTGTYNGNGYVIDKLYIKRNSSSFNGLFGYANAANISYLGVTNVNITGYMENGGLVGSSRGSTVINNCFSTGSIKGYERYNGGLVGENMTSTLSNCYSTCSVTAYTSNDYVGGLIGSNMTSTINNCFSTGAVTGTSDYGGLIGYNAGTSYFNNCFWDKQTSGKTTSAGGTGKTTAEMKQAGIYISASWDFTKTGNKWAMNGADNSGYPFLRTQSYTPAAIWLGTSSTLWATVGNWSENSVPSGTVIIPNVTNDPVITYSGATSSNLTIESGGALTLTVNGCLTVGALTNSGTLNIQSDATGVGTLVDNGITNINGTVNVQQYLTGTGGITPNGRFWYISSPVSDATSETFNAAGNNKLWSHSESGYAYTEITDNSTSLNAGQGYVARLGADATVSFTGTALNTGSQTINITRTGTELPKRGFNLIGNPYPSYLDWTSATKTNVQPTMWYRTLTSGNLMQFDTYNAETGVGTGNGAKGTVTRYIPPMQAFWVKATTDNVTGTVVFTNSLRSHQSSNPLRSPRVGENQTIRLRTSNGTNSDETILAFITEATDGFDKYDSPKMFNDVASIPEIYTLAGNEQVVINGLEPVVTEKELPVGFKTALAGTFTIMATEITNMDEGTRVTLEDKLLDKKQNLTENPEYSFSSDIVNATDRFSIFISKIPTNLYIVPEQSFTVLTGSGGKLEILLKGFENKLATINIFTALGQKLLTIPVTGETSHIRSGFIPGFYLVSIYSDGFKATKKIVINQ